MMKLSDTTARLLASAAAAGLLAGGPAQAQSNEELLRRIEELESTQRAAREALMRRIEELEAVQRVSRQAPVQPARSTPSGTAAGGVRPATPVPLRSAAVAAPAVLPAAAAPAVSPEQQRQITHAQMDEALRGELGAGSFRIPGTETSVRLYGFVKTNLFGDLDMVNRGDAPSVQGIPLAGSAATQQSGDTQFSARRSRIGFDTQTPTEWGPFTSKIEFDFTGDQPSASGAATSSGYMPRLRQA
jgi:hypothetical protein